MIGPTPPGAPVRAVLSNGVPVLIDVEPRFRTVTLKLVLHRPLDRDNTRGALLVRMLERGCRGAPDLRAVVRRLESLYGAGLDFDVLKIGERQILQAHLQVLADRAISGGSGTLVRAIEFFRRLVCEPVLVREAFPAEVLEQEKENLRRHIEAVVNDKAEFAAHRLIQEMCRDEPYRLFEYGEVKSIARIGGRDLAAFHARLLREAPMEIYVCGGVRPAEILQRMERAFGFPRKTPKPIPPPVLRPAPDVPREVVESERDIEQGKLVMGFRTGVSLAHDDIYAAVMLNGLLGGFSHSRLFRAFREKAGLAYSVGSWVEKTKDLLQVEAGIDAGAYRRGVDLVRAELADLASGRISDEEIDLTLRALLERAEALRDHPAQRLNFYLERALHQREETIRELPGRLRAVRREDVIRMAGRLRLDTVYFLRPEARSPE